MTLLCYTYLWSIGVLEYWKNINLTPIFCNLEQTEAIEILRCIEFMDDRPSLQDSNTPFFLETVTGRADYL